MPKNTNLVVTPGLEKSLRAKTLKDLVRISDTDNPNLLLDCSGSMNERMRNGKKRIEGLRAVVQNVQAKKPTAMIAFGPTFGFNESKDPNVFNPYEDDAPKDGDRYVLPEMRVVDFVSEVPEPQGGTPLHLAIDFARQKGVGRLLLISDGQPNDMALAMTAARNFGGKIDVVYVGDPGDMGSIFLDDLAKATGGQRFEGDLTDVRELENTVIGLLTGEVMEEVDDDDDEDEDEDEDLDDDDDDLDEDDDA
jgi:hypothetical protein